MTTLTSERIHQIEAFKGWVWDLSEENFQEGLIQLKKYVEQGHSARVPKGYIDDDGFALGSWVSHRRTEFNKNKLPAERIQQLETIEGWVWSA